MPRSKLLTTYTATKIDARKLPEVYIKRQPKLVMWLMVIGSFSTSCGYFFASLALTIWEIQAKYKRIRCLPKVSRFFLPFSLIHAAYIHKIP